MKPDRRPILSAGAPRAIGPYSQGLLCGEVLYCSGQIGLDPETGALVTGGTAAECERALENLQAVLQAAEMGLDDVVKTTIYLVDLSEFAAVNELYARYFREPFPARSTVGANALPRGARIEIEAVAQKHRSRS